MSLNKKIAVGAFWSVLTRLGVKSLGFVSLLILARLLFPEDFGLIALTMSTVAFFEIFTKFGFDVNIIQKDEVHDSTLNSAWSCQLFLGFFISLCIVASSSSIADFFADDRLVNLMMVTAGIPLIKAFENIGFVLHRKNLDLKKEFHLEIISKLVSFFTLVIAGVVLRSYWALLLGIYASTLTRVVLSYYMHPFRPKLDFSEAKDLFVFSKWLLLNNLLIFFNHQVNTVILGNKSDTNEVGLFSMSYEISNLPTSEIVFPLSRAIFPGYSLIKNDLVKLRTMFLDFTGLIIFITAPISFGIAAVAEPLVAVMLGNKWESAASVIAILALCGFMRSSVQNVGNVFVSRGVPKITVLLSTIRLIIIIPLLLTLVPQKGALGAAYSVLIAGLLTTPAGFILCAKLLKIRLIDIARAFFAPLTFSLLMSFIVVGINEYWLVGASNLSRLIVMITFGTVTYGGLTYLYINRLQDAHIVKRVTVKIMGKLKRV